MTATETRTEERQRKLASINKRVVVERKLHAPWSTAGIEKTYDKSVAQEALAAGVNVRDTFHHYYKKHMTLLGLRKELDSSDTDSETSENYTSKLFRRRQHRLKPRAVHPFEAAERQRREEMAGKPWAYRCPSIDDVGIQNVERPHRGKKTAGFPTSEELSQRRKRDAESHLRQVETHRKTPLMRLHEAVEESRGLQSMFRNEWDERQAREDAAIRRRRHDFTPPPVAPTPAELTRQRLQQEYDQGSGSKSRRSVSSMTLHKMDRELQRIRRDHAEAMTRHKMIIEAVAAIPIQPV